MNRQQFDSIIKKSPYHVFVFSTRPSFPLNFAIHTYIVTVTSQVTHRWEVHWSSFRDSKHKDGHLHLNYQKPWEGRYKYLGSKKFLFQSKLLYHIGGDQKIAKLIFNIEDQIKRYPYKYHYRFWGINSNSFTQWVINQNPELKVKLPWNAFGRKNFTD